MKNNRPYLRSIAEDAHAGGSASPEASPSVPTPAEVAARTTKSAAPASPSDSSAKDAPADEDEDSHGRGSKREVLADLARERDKRQALQEEVKILKEDYERFSKAAAQVEEYKKRLEALEAEKTAQTRQADIDAALTAAKLPAEMAERLRGETREELEADAKALAEALGIRQPIDPAQGKGAAHVSTNSLAEAFRSHYNV